MSVIHVWDMECKNELGWQTEGLSTQIREPPFLLNDRILPRKMDKRYVTLAKNMHVKLLNSICRACFDFISIMTDCLSMNRVYMAHIGKGCTLSQCWVMKRFSILTTP